MSGRRESMLNWLREDLGIRDFDIAPASSDASFRGYFRVRTDDASHIVMDAPPEHEDTQPFVRIARLFRDAGLNVPEILAEQSEQGFLLLSDLGSRQYLDELNADTAESLYGDALSALATLQARGPHQPGDLPPYDRELLMSEMSLFPDWLLERHLGIALNDEQRQVLSRTFVFLADTALEQPQVCVHRDYHSRNLMLLPSHNPGVLDFQDAVIGPVTYDLVSLLRDAYIEWPRAQIEEWVRGYYELALRSGILPGPHQEEGEAGFLRWFDFMGLQRHLKVCGIFARLLHRDGKTGYIKDIPRTFGYIQQVAPDYPELADFNRLMTELNLPARLRRADTAA